MTPLSASEERTLSRLRDAGVLGQSSTSLQELADLYMLRDRGLVTFTGGASFGVWRPVAFADMWGEAR